MRSLLARTAVHGEYSGELATAEPGPPPLGSAASQRDTAQYIADMILELRNIAKAARLFTITVPLEFAYYEAFSVANRVDIPLDELERIKALARQASRQEEPDDA